jgi:hypothetical protein
MMPQIKTVKRTVTTKFVEVAGKWRFPISQEVTVTDQQTIAGGSQQEKLDDNLDRSGTEANLGDTTGA